MSNRIKVVGRKIRSGYSIEEANSLLELANDLRRGKTFIPKGVYRFKTHEEANLWQIRMILGQKPESQQ